MKKLLFKVLCLVICGVILFHATGCGTFLHPERVGQGPTGALDPGIVILDALLLLFFIIPGVVAFAIDISNDTIYLPGGYAARPEDVRLVETRLKIYREEETQR